MLLELEVKNFALIDHLHLQLEKGLNILTGETGAGKSILIDALNMALGERADREFVRTGANKCTIQAVFDFPQTKGIDRLLEEYGIDSGEPIVITREIHHNGRSICRINGTIVTQGLLKSITQRLIDIHGQHQHQSLLDSQAHIDLLDAYGGEAASRLLSQLSEQYQHLCQLQTSLRTICANEMERERKIDLLRFQIQEIESANLKKGEEEELNSEKNRMANRERIFKAIHDSYHLLHEGNQQRPILDDLSHILGQLHQVTEYDERLQYFYETLADIQYRLEDITREIRDYKEETEFEPRELEEIELRLDLINGLKRKYGKSIQAIIDYQKEISKELFLIENSEKEIQRLKQEIKVKRVNMEKLAMALSSLRKEIAYSLEKSLTEILQTLNMGKVSFQVNIQTMKDSQGQYRLGSKGFDQVEFLISTNLGEPLKPLAKIASGGEMSRIMLALKRILADVDHIPTLIFDEIDTGISGKTAQVVGKNMYELSQKHQIICITHLPQIASLADCHFLIEKHEGSQSTKTIVKKLSKKEQINEVGRLLGGELTDITLRHAEEMIGQAKS